MEDFFKCMFSAGVGAAVIIFFHSRDVDEFQCHCSIFQFLTLVKRSVQNFSDRMVCEQCGDRPTILSVW